jgi:hypothetical protein
LGRTVEELLETVSYTELTEWMAYYAIEPFGYDMENYRMGVIASTVMNANRSKNSDKVWSAKDFMPTETEVQSPDKQELAVRKMFEMFNEKR